MKWTPPEIEDYIDIFSVKDNNRETESEEPDVTTKTYCRGLTLAQIGIPRLPHGIRSKDVYSNKIHVQAAFNALPKSRGRGRAKMLEEREDHFMRLKNFNDKMNCLENMDTSSTIDSTSINGGSETSSMFGDCEFSDSDDVIDKPILLPSQRNIKLPERPFVKPKHYDFNSVDDFPLLGSQDSDGSSIVKVAALKKKPARRKPKEDQGSSKQWMRSETNVVKSKNSNQRHISDYVISDKKTVCSSQKGFPIQQKGIQTTPANSLNSKRSSSGRNGNLNTSIIIKNDDLTMVAKTLNPHSVAESIDQMNSYSDGNICQVQTPHDSFDTISTNLDIVPNTFGSFSRPHSSNKMEDVDGISQASQVFPSIPKSTLDNSKCVKQNLVATVKPTVTSAHNNLNPTNAEACAIENIQKHTQQNTMLDWKITGPCVVQLEGIPIACDINILDDTLSNFGPIEESQVQVINGKYAIRYRFSTEDACEWVVSSLHDTDMLYPDSQSVLVCFKVQ